jgi:uncharacterized protein
MAENINPVRWFDLPVSDMDRAVDFYEHVLRIRLDRQAVGDQEMAWFPSGEGSGCAGSLVRHPEYRPSSDGVRIYFTTPDIPGTLERAVERGGKQITPRTSLGPYGFYGVMEDPEGNWIGLHSGNQA